MNHNHQDNRPSYFYLPTERGVMTFIEDEKPTTTIPTPESKPRHFSKFAASVIVAGGFYMSLNAVFMLRDLKITDGHLNPNFIKSIATAALPTSAALLYFIHNYPRGKQGK